MKTMKISTTKTPLEVESNIKKWNSKRSTILRAAALEFSVGFLF
jgi:hypothetical protein